jgi:hypothetical protein
LDVFPAGPVTAVDREDQLPLGGNGSVPSFRMVR